MGVDEEWLNRQRNEVPYLNELKKKHFLITYFGTLGFARNPQFLLRTFAEIRSKYPKLQIDLDWKDTYGLGKKRTDINL